MRFAMQLEMNGIKATGTSLLLAGLLAATSVSANDNASTASNEAGNLAQTRAEYHAAQDPGIDAAVNAIVRELAAVGTGPRDARGSNSGAGIGRSLHSQPATLVGAESARSDAATELAEEAAAARALLGGADEGEDDHAM